MLAALAVVYIAGLRLWFDLHAPAMGDETYYWMWGQRLGWSYFDHPPLDAWLQAGVAALFGWSTFSLRLLTWLSLGGTLVLLWLWAKRLRPAGAPDLFWRSATILLTVPVMVLFTIQASHDHLLVLFAVAALYSLWRFVEDWEAARRGIRFLYLAGVALGLATLTKYNGALLAPGFVALFVFRPSLRSALRTPHPYLAALLAVAMQAPVIYWNLTEGLATLRFHFLERPSGHWDHASLMQGVGFLVESILVAGPVLVLSLVRAPWAMRVAPQRTVIAIALTVFAVATGIVFIASLFTDILLHWNIVAYVALGLAGVWLLGRWLIWPHVLLGLYLTTVMVLNYSVGPLAVPGFVDPGTAAMFGWPEVRAAVTEAQKQHPQAFLAATKYDYASQLGFALHSADVTAINPLRSQYDIWWSAAAHLGQDAIIVADQRNPIELSSPWFNAVSKLAEVPVVVNGQQIWSFDIYLGQGYQPR